MAANPFSPFAPSEVEPEASQLDGTLFLRAQLYRAFARLGFAPQDVDGMEMWQAAALLGMDKTESEREQSIAERMAAERDTLVERAARIREMRGTPEPGQSEDITDEVMRQMGIKVI